MDFRIVVVLDTASDVHTLLTGDAVKATNWIDDLRSKVEIVQVSTVPIINDNICLEGKTTTTNGLNFG